MQQLMRQIAMTCLAVICVACIGNVEPKPTPVVPNIGGEEPRSDDEEKTGDEEAVTGETELTGNNGERANDDGEEEASGDNEADEQDPVDPAAKTLSLDDARTAFENFRHSSAYKWKARGACAQGGTSTWSRKGRILGINEGTYAVRACAANGVVLDGDLDTRNLEVSRQGVGFTRLRGDLALTGALEGNCRVDMRAKASIKGNWTGTFCGHDLRELTAMQPDAGEPQDDKAKPGVQ